MNDIIYIVCASTTGSSTSSSNSNKFHKWVKTADGQYTHSWGRVGTPGQSQTVSEAKMQAKLRSSLKEGYQQVEVAADAAGGTVNGPAVAKADVRQQAVRDIAGGNAELAKLVEMLVDRNTREITAGTTLKLNSATGLFQTDGGIVVTRKVVDEARDLLGKINGLFTGQTKGVLTLPAMADAMTCNYLMRIPTNIGRARPTFSTVFPNGDAVRKQEQILDALLGSLDMLAKPPTTPDAPKVEAKKVWNVAMTPVDSREFKRISDKFFATYQRQHAAAHAGLKPVRAWTLDIAHMTAAFANDGAKVGNVQELWHGTRVGNLLSILARGLIIPPWADAGRFLGDAIYFSDQSTKSLNYAYGYWNGGTRDHTCYMLLNDVAMGNAYYPTHQVKGPPPGYDSVWARGGTCGLANNEMTVYRASQARVTRLVEFSA